MELKEAIEIIENINNYSEEELLKIYLEVYKTLISYYYYTDATTFIVELIKKVKDIDTKIKLIKQYLLNKKYKVFQSIENLNYNDKKKVFKELFKNYKFEEIKEILNIPEDLFIGIELEYCDLSYNALTLLFNSNSVKALMDILNINKDIIKEIKNNTIFKEKSQFDKWTISTELDNEKSPELSTPILQNKIEDLNKIKAFYYLLYALGAKTNNCTALHINVDVDYFEENKNALKYLLSIWEQCEELFYKIANKEGTILRTYADEMAMPIKENIQKTFEEGYDFNTKTSENFCRFLYNLQVRKDLENMLRIPYIEDYKEYEKYENAETEDERYQVYRKMFGYSFKDIIGRTKYRSINFTHMYNEGRIEFRLFNNIMDFETILLNITLVGRLMYVCKELGKNNPILLEKYNELLNTDVSEEEKLDLLLNLLFEDNTKDIFKKRWESVKDERRYKKYYTGTPTFIRENKQLKKTTNN